MKGFVPIKGYEGSYVINKDGIVISLERKITTISNVVLHINRKELKRYYDARGDLVVQLSKKGSYKVFLISDLIKNNLKN